jgi:cytidylate kinase
MKNILMSYLSQDGPQDTGKLFRPGPVVTISRECGCSANRIATKLSKILTGYNYLSETKTDVEWRWVSKEVIEMAAGELKMHPGRIKNGHSEEIKQSIYNISAAFSKAKVYDTTDQITTDTVKSVIRNIAEKGHYIIVGRAANFITQDIPNRLSIKLQAPLDWRINRMMQISNLTWSNAQKYVLEVDRQRNAYVEHVAEQQQDNNDFDLIFNYSTMLDDHIVDAIVNILKNKKIIENSESD